jgi:hypothetical protein
MKAIRTWCAFCGEDIIRSADEDERQAAAQVHIMMCRLHPVREARLHIETFVALVEHFQLATAKGAEPPANADRVLTNAKAWLDREGGA